jgi:SAM-dependent methyltransferase
MGTTDDLPPNVKDFYDGLFHSPIYAGHHRVCCNVGFHSGGRRASSSAPEIMEDANDVVAKFRAAQAQDQCQLQLYKELIALAGEDHPLLTRRKKLAIMDVGCGAGGGLCELQALFPQAELAGLDLSIQALERSKESWHRFTAHVPKFRDKKLRLYHQSCEIMRGVSPCSLDVVVAVQSLQEVRDLDQGVSELERVLKPGGLLFIADFIPPDAQADHLHRSLLGPIASGSPTAKHADAAPAFQVVHERMASFEAAMGSKMSSAKAEELIQQYTPEEFHEELKAFFFVENSPLYEMLARDQMGYRLVCLQKLKTAADADAEYANWSDGSSASDEVESEAESESESESESEAAIYDDDMLNYYSYPELFPQLQVLENNYHVILEEMQAVQQGASWPFWPEKHYTEEDSEWRVFPFCYTFPAYDASKTVWVPPTCELCPRTVEILRGIPGIRTALFSKLGPNTTLTAHRGWADLSNDILRCHLPLVVPRMSNGEQCCAMVVGGESLYHEEGQVFVFDDSKLHYAFNHHNEKTRIVLIVDLYRPDHLPRGRARGGHSDELDEFIDKFGRQMLNGDDGE